MGQEKGDGIMSQPSATFQVFSLESRWLFEEARRLDASFYARDVIAARILISDIQKHGFRIDRVHDLADGVFWPGRFKRRYVSKDIGKPFLMPSEAIMFLPKTKKFVVNYPEGVAVKRDWLLITRSGTVGRCLLATRFLENHVLSDDLIRIILKNVTNVSYLYAYLNTRIGQAFLTKDQYGSTVKHIEPHHVASIPIPRIPDFERRISRMVLQAHSLREEAQQFLLRANMLLYTELGLPEIDEEDVQYFGGERGRLIKSFGIKKSQLNLRLDASYHSPILRQIDANLSNLRFKKVRLGEVTARIFVPGRFKRAYVKDSNAGVPFLQGSHIPQIKPMDIRYIWKKTKRLEDILIKKDWVLMTRSGTVGRIGIVSKELEGWAASEHVFRILLSQEVNPGYIAAFLNSPYGEYQIKGKIYGAVVDEIGEQDTSLIEEINIVLPTRDIQDKIGNLFFEAYDKRDEANRLEDELRELAEK